MGPNNSFGWQVSCSRQNPHGGASSKGWPSGSAYVTYKHTADAERCIKEMDGVTVDGKVVRACFGTTKYCNSFLKGLPCNNSDCLYLHAIGEPF